MGSRRQLGLAIAIALVAAELLLRISGYRVSPSARRPASDDVRVTYLSSTDFCGAPPAPRRDPEAKLLIFLGDTSACGPTPVAHWTLQLQALLDLNSGDGSRHQIVDAGVSGYSSLQGLRRFEQVLDYRPDVVFYAFGAADAQEVRISDAAYAAREQILDRLATSRVVLLAGRAFGLLRFPTPANARLVPRVPPDEFRNHTREFVARAWRRHVVPVLVVPDEEGAVAAYAEVVRHIAGTDGVLVVDRARPRSYPVAGSQDDRGRAFQVAVSVLEMLRTLGVVATDRILDRVAEPGRMEDYRAELGSGLWGREVWKGGQAGRWTGEVATIALERRADEGGLALEASFLHPENRTRLRVEVDGSTVGVLESANGLVNRTLDIRSLRGPRPVIRLVAERPFIPGNGDNRTLGVFLHRLALVPSPKGDELLLAELPASAPELGEGWWLPEEWGDGQRGRWTRGVATLRMERRHSERLLLLDLAGGHPGGRAPLRVEINGAFVGLLQVKNASAIYAIDLPKLGGTVLEVRLIAEQPFVPRLIGPQSTDERELGVFVRAVRLGGGSG